MITFVSFLTSFPIIIGNLYAHSLVLCKHVFQLQICDFLRLVDELFTLHKEAALKIAREHIRSLILETLILMQK